MRDRLRRVERQLWPSGLTHLWYGVLAEADTMRGRIAAFNGELFTPATPDELDTAAKAAAATRQDPGDVLIELLARNHNTDN